MQRKGEIGAEFPYWRVYIFLAAAVFIALVTIPEALLKPQLDTQALENEIYNNRLFTALSHRERMTNELSVGIINTLDEAKVQKAFDVGLGERLGFVVVIDDKPVYVDQRFYEDARPLAPGRYKLFAEQRPVLHHDTRQLTSAAIEQVYNPRILEP